MVKAGGFEGSFQFKALALERIFMSNSSKRKKFLTLNEQRSFEMFCNRGNKFVELSLKCDLKPFMGWKSFCCLTFTETLWSGEEEGLPNKLFISLYAS